MPSGAKTMLEAFGVGEMPWVIRAYLFLTISLLLMLLIVLMLPTKADVTLLGKFVDLVLDLVKLLVGAFLGGLSLAAERRLGK